MVYYTTSHRIRTQATGRHGLASVWGNWTRCNLAFLAKFAKCEGGSWPPGIDLDPLRRPSSSRLQEGRQQQLLGWHVKPLARGHRVADHAFP